MSSSSGPSGALSRRSPLWAAVALTWIDNIGAFTALVGVLFVAKYAYGFSPAQSLGLGMVQGAMYVLAALCAGVGSRRLSGPGRALSTRALLAWMHVALAGVCWIPILWRSPWSLWLVMGLYAPLAGWLWPLIESFLSAGRTGADLRRSSAWFNLSWASCQVATFWLIAPFMERHPLWAVPVMGLSHLAALPLVMCLRPDPAPHGEGGHQHDPRERALYRRLLGAHRSLLVLSYVVYSALGPLLPSIADRLGVSEKWAPPLCSVWTFSRLAMFWAMGAWGGWHGRAATLVWPASLLMAGLALSLLAPTPPILGLGLALFGLGMGAVYASAFYYAMEVGAAGVDAGGKHEALIGVGYSVGPALGLAASAISGTFGEPALGHRLATLVLVLFAAALIGGASARALRRRR